MKKFYSNRANHHTPKESVFSQRIDVTMSVPFFLKGYEAIMLVDLIADSVLLLSSDTTKNRLFLSDNKKMERYINHIWL